MPQSGVHTALRIAANRLLLRDAEDWVSVGFCLRVCAREAEDRSKPNRQACLWHHSLIGTCILRPWRTWVAVQVGGGTVGGVAVADCGRARLEVVVAVRAIDEERILGEVVRPRPPARALVVSAR